METKQKTPCILILQSYYEAIQELENDDQLTIFKAIMEFGFNQVQPSFEKKYLNGYLKLIEPTLSKGIKNYNTKVANGAAGGKAKAAKAKLLNEEANNN
jgi:hypothetical protein